MFRAQLLEATLDSIGDGILTVDHELRIVEVNRAASEILGLPPAELVGAPLDRLIPAWMAGTHAQLARRWLTEEHGALRRSAMASGRTIAYTRSDGSERQLFIDLTRIESAEQRWAVAVVRDVTTRFGARRELEQEQAAMRTVINAMPGQVAIVSTEGLYRFANQAFAAAAGVAAEQVIGRRAREVLGEAEFERRLPSIRRAMSGETVSFELPYSQDNEERWRSYSYVPIRMTDGSPGGFVVFGHDVTAEHRERSRLLDLSLRDPLTGLLNRAGLEQRLQDLERGQLLPFSAALYIDLDRFKPVNDRHGHPVGDRLLQLFGQRLRALVRGSDAVARIGGDEFVLLLVNIGDRTQAEAVADKVLAAAATPFEVDGVDLVVGASLGVAFGGDEPGSGQSLLARADTHLLRAKREGRGRWESGR